MSILPIAARILRAPYAIAVMMAWLTWGLLGGGLKPLDAEYTRVILWVPGMRR